MAKKSIQQKPKQPTTSKKEKGGRTGEIKAAGNLIKALEMCSESLITK